MGIENLNWNTIFLFPMIPQNDQPSPFQWKRSKYGTWEREIDECETFYLHTKRNDSAYYPVIGCASFAIKSADARATNKMNRKDDGERSLVGNSLLKAWEVLCYEHPTLRSRIEHDKACGAHKRVYSTFQDTDEQKDWLKSTFEVIHTDEDPLRWFNEQDRSFDGSKLLLVIPEDGVNCNPTIFLQCSHDITDGVGILQLVDQLFQHAASAYEQSGQYVLPVWGDEHVKLSPCLRSAAIIPEPSPEVQEKRFREIQTHNSSIYMHPSLLSLPPSSRTASSPGKRHRLSIFVPHASTDQIILKCKAIAPGVSVTHVFMAALAMALAELQPPKEESYVARYVNHSMINLRPYCQAPYNTPKHAAAPYHAVSAQALGIDVTVPGLSADKGNNKHADNLLELALQVRDFYRAVRPTSSQDEQVVLSPLMFKSLTAPPGSDPHAVSDPPFCPVVISSLGNIGSTVSANHGPFELKSVWAASEPIGAGVAIFLGTWNGRIELSGVFDTRYHDAGYIHDLLERISQCVCKGLMVEG